MTHEKDLEGKICPIDETQLEVKQWRGTEQYYVSCSKCGAVYKDPNDLENEAKKYLRTLREWSLAELEQYIKKEKIIGWGHSKGLI